ncbi:PIN domain-containing protein [Candidatus Poriferisodalis sp.]|uniref:PIN domain-containing protein n=1 Tax=Candidatus Poriferisodalis sp. TaxID=3101277 RepID=UPI003B526107
MAVVLDTWPVMHFLQGRDPIRTMTTELLERSDAVMSWINLGEVFYSVRRRWGAEAADSVLQRLSANVTADIPTPTRVIEAATLKSEYAMSYADAFAAATAIAHDAELWTGDPELLRPDAPWRWRDLRAER